MGVRIANSVLVRISREDPGRYLTDQESQEAVAESAFLGPRIRAMLSAQRLENEIVKAAVEPVLKKYDFHTGRGGLGQGKCYRDVASVYRYCVFAMVCDDVDMLRDKLLYWLRTILQSLSFHADVESIRMTYSGLRREVARRFPPEDAVLLDPYFKATEEILPKK